MLLAVPVPFDPTPLPLPSPAFPFRSCSLALFEEISKKDPSIFPSDYPVQRARLKKSLAEKGYIWGPAGSAAKAGTGAVDSTPLQGRSSSGRRQRWQGWSQRPCGV